MPLAAAQSAAFDASTPTAAARAAARLQERLQHRRPDLLLAFFSPHHVPNAQHIADQALRRLDPRCFLGVSAAGVLAGRLEVEHSPALALLALVAPGVELRPFAAPDLPVGRYDHPDAPHAIRQALAAHLQPRAVLLFTDPPSMPAPSLLAALSGALTPDAPQAAPPPILGGIASASAAPGGNRLLLADSIHLAGLVGVAIAGPVRVDSFVSQGCKPFGPNLIVTRARRNLILQLGGRPALQALRDIVEDLPPPQRSHLKSGLLLGVAVSEYRRHFGRDDFIIRPLVGVEEANDALACSQPVRVGQTVRFHYRDARSAHDDLAMLLDAQQLHDPPAAVCLFSSTHRGTDLFPTPNHDAQAVVRAFSHAPGGPQSAKVGAQIEPGPGDFPLAGMRTAAEFGPLAGTPCLHSHSATAAIFREPSA